MVEGEVRDDEIRGNLKLEQIMQGPVDYYEDLDFYSDQNGKLLEDFEHDPPWVSPRLL